jgi:hypothetical protein
MAHYKFSPKSPVVIAVLYSVCAFLLIVVFRLIYPDIPNEKELLKIFLFKAKLSKGVLNFIELFPAIFMSALVIPFAIKPVDESGGVRFSKTFLDMMSTRIISCIAASIIFGILVLCAQPLLNNYQTQIQAESKLYNASRIKAAEYAEKKDWVNAGHFIMLCDRIWKDNPALTELHFDVDNGIENYRYSRAMPAEERKTAVSGSAGQKQPVSAEEAIVLAREALNEEHYYDANWFSHLAQRLAREGSIEYAQATRLSALSWNAIASLAPSLQEEKQFTLYRRKRDGYEALVNNDWIRAYYIFKALLPLSPGDPDVEKYFTMSEAGLKSIAFFLDEMDLAVGNIQNDVLFSLPHNEISAGGRVVMRIGSLTSFKDAAFGRDLEIIAFDAAKQPVFSVTAALIKIMPVEVAGVWRTMILMRAVDRHDEAIVQEPEWLIMEAGIYAGTQLFLNLSYEDFLLAVAANSTRGFFLNDLWTGAAILGSMGYIPQIFYTDIIRALYTPLLFLPLGIFALIIGWKYRSKRKVPYALPPMFFVLPVVFQTIVVLIGRIFNLISTWTVLSFGFTQAIVICLSSAAALFLLTLFLLAAQRGGSNEKGTNAKNIKS